VFIFSIKPVLPIGRILEHNTSIAFLGGILERVSPGNEHIAAKGNVSLEYKIDNIQASQTGFIDKHLEKEEFAYSLEDRGSLNLNAYHKIEIARVSFSDFFIKGQAKDRPVIYKPDLDRIVTLPSDFNSGFRASIRFKISKQGFVNYAECAVSSGFPEIDRIAMRYVKEWQFVPGIEDGQEGIVRVSFK